MKTGQPLLVPDALENEAWKANPHVKLGMISYLGVPISWPDGRLFGTICVRDNKRNEYSEAYLKLLLHFRDMLQADLKSMVRLHGEIEERETKIRRLVDANIIGIFVWDVEGRILEANDAFLRLIGYDREDVVAGRLRWTDLTPPEWLDRDERRWLPELKVTGSLQPFEKEYFRKDGSRVPVLIGVATFDDDGNQGVAFVLDLTERKRAEQALLENEDKLRQIFETASGTGSEGKKAEVQPEFMAQLQAVLNVLPAYTWYAPPSGSLTFVSKRQGDFLGLPKDHPLRFGIDIGAPWDAHIPFLHPDDQEAGRKYWANSLRTGEGYVHNYRVRDAQGNYRWLLTRTEPLRANDGTVLLWVGATLDIEELMRAQEALGESERSSRSALDGIAGLVSILAPDGEVEAANRQFLEYFGSLEWVKNWETNDAVHPEDFPRIAKLFKRAIASGVPFQHELRLRRFDGEYRWFENRGVPVRDDSGRIVRWYVLLTDIEDRKRALAQLDQMQSDFAHMNRVSMMGEWAAELSHEITQPIASARNNARAAQNFLDMQPPDLSEVREALSCVVGDTDRAGDIIDRIRDHIKKAPPRKEQFDLNEAIDEVIVLGRSAIIKNRVWVQTRLSEGLFPVHGDRVQLQQVVLNLLLNALEAMGSVEAAPRELLISTKQDGTGVLVAVRDSGPGIDPSHRERVFDAFYTTKPSGTGMGLSICRSIIDAHGGRLWAEANEPRGTIFQFTLPAVP
jgi:PAS domain S-box-containing protein